MLQSKHTYPHRALQKQYRCFEERLHNVWGLHLLACPVFATLLLLRQALSSCSIKAPAARKNVKNVLSSAKALRTATEQPSHDPFPAKKNHTLQCGERAVPHSHNASDMNRGALIHE